MKLSIFINKGRGEGRTRRDSISGFFESISFVQDIKSKTFVFKDLSTTPKTSKKFFEENTSAIDQSMLMVADIGIDSAFLTRHRTVEVHTGDYKRGFLKPQAVVSSTSRPQSEATFRSMNPEIAQVVKFSSYEKAHVI